MLLFGLGALVLLSHAFVPADKFILRSDDAYYYFGVAANCPSAGFWTFEGIHPTNGVQPLWAVLLTGLAQVLTWLGLTDRDLLARVFVALCALCHLLSCILLFRILATRVSRGTAWAATGGLMFSMSLVWAHVWGLENSLYAFLLLATVAYIDRLGQRTDAVSAVVVGGLLGLTALARLNAAVLAPMAIGYVLLRSPGGFARWRNAALAAAVAATPFCGYLLINYGSTGHWMPISGAVKATVAAQFLETVGVEDRLSPQFWITILRRFVYSMAWFVKSRTLDGLWCLGSRVVFRGDSAVGLRAFAAVVTVVLVTPAFVIGPKRWLTLLGQRFGCLKPFTYVLVFAASNALVSVAMYPDQLRYAMFRWWVVESEVILVVLSATLAAAFVRAFASVFLPSGRHASPMAAALLLLAVFHATDSFLYYWGDRRRNDDWNASWNDESYAAARWLSENVPDEARVGSWNAGVLGYYADQRVVNLDGLINNFELLPHLRDGTVGRYILDQDIVYLSDMDSLIRKRVGDQLILTALYRNHCALIDDDYVIYKVQGPLAPIPDGGALGATGGSSASARAGKLPVAPSRNSLFMGNGGEK